MTLLDYTFLVILGLVVIIGIISHHNVKVHDSLSSLLSRFQNLHFDHLQQLVEPAAPVPIVIPPAKTDFGPLPPNPMPPTPPAPTPAPVAQPLGPATITALGGEPTGNNEGVVIQPGYDAASEIKDSTTILVGAGKWRTPPGLKTFLLAVEQNQAYMLLTSDGYAPIDVKVTRYDGTTLAHAESGGGTAQILFVAEASGWVNILTDYKGTSRLAGIAAYKTEAAPQTKV